MGKSTETVFLVFGCIGESRGKENEFLMETFPLFGSWRNLEGKFFIFKKITLKKKKKLNKN